VRVLPSGCRPPQATSIAMNPATADTVVSNHDLIIASGNTHDLDKFSALQS